MNDFVIRRARAADLEQIVRVLADSWGSTSVVVHGQVYNASTLPALLAERDGELAGLLTYTIVDDGLEIVTLDALTRHGGVGTALLEVVTGIAEEAGLRRVWLVTTNDNLDALRFYQRRGLRIVKVDPGAVDVARRHKPSIPAIGDHGIEIHDELTLELLLPAGSARP
ncbi:GNAT family N-acetyltransferase [Sphaerimonospora thailandensis]|uniref:N-acetyltransferase n=1 Tax=Sphaerimonospora thailandensis TaxID=795644 RepID=A0A8J3VZ62_9ACTN|nr:GNAT family N-acetyltransferase [Sphaerimonospora thailandensis]GIH69571.1 N-acetyltransferase [Sphaerimonospora thailandensis]